jgi:hypothetical protein
MRMLGDNGGRSIAKPARHQQRHIGPRQVGNTNVRLHFLQNGRQPAGLNRVRD